jgi:hypothetical protein
VLRGEGKGETIFGMTKVVQILYQCFVHDLSPGPNPHQPRFARRVVASVVAAALAFAPTVRFARTGEAESIEWVRAARADEAGTAGAIEIELLAFSSNDAVEEASALTEAFKHAMLKAQGVTEHGASGKGHALEAILLTVGCDDAATPACAAKIAAEIKHDRFFFGTVKKSPPNKLTATLSYYNKGDIKTVARTYDAGPISKDGVSPELQAIALEALYGLIGGPPKGKVDVTVSGTGATESGDLFENGTKVGHVEAGKATIELPSGSHTIELRIPGYGSTTGTVDVTPAGTTLQLAPIKLAPPQPMDWQLYGGLSAIAVGAVFVGVGVATSLSIKDAQEDPVFTAYRQRFPPSVSDTCEKAQAGNEGNKKVGDPNLAPQAASLCDKVSSKQKMQFVWYGLGAVFIGGGVVLILTDKNGEKTDAGGKTASAKPPVLEVKVQPTFGPNYNALSIVGSF